MFSTSRNQANLSGIGSPGFAPFVAGRFAHLLTKLREFRARRAAIAALQALPDRSLADIGLRREDIPRAVRG